jgi:hypothetical protein
MARTGRFGRLPRAAPNLSSTIVSLAREMAALEDSNILNAWEEGGLYKGKKVTDSMLLDHFRKRRDGLSKTDPLWDKWDQALTNYTFSIEESKMSLKYAQHKVGEGQMAAFYTSWAKKLPTDSEAYRELMRSAAQFADAASSGGGGGGGGRGGNNQAAYDSAVTTSYDRYERKWDDANYFMLNAAYRAGILQMTDTADPDDLMDLRGGDEADHQRFMELFDLVQTDPYYADIKAAMGESGMGGLTYAQFLSFADAKTTGISARGRIAEEFGDSKGAKDALEEKTEFLIQRNAVADIDEYSAYQTIRRDVDSAISKGGLSPFEKVDLLTGYGRRLNQLRGQAMSEEDRGFFNNELLALSGRDVVGPTAYEGNVGGIRSRDTADSSYLASHLANAAEQVELINSGQAFLQSGVDENGAKVYGTINVNDQRLSDTGIGRVFFNSEGAGSRRSVPTYVPFRPISVMGKTGQDPNTGASLEQIPPTTDNLIGMTYTLNGRQYYGIYVPGTAGQQMRWFTENPFTSNDLSVDENGGLVVNVSLNEQDILRGGSAGEAGFDMYKAVSQRALDPDLQFTGRYDSPLTAVYVTDQRAREALMTTSERELANVIAAVHGEGIEGELAFREIRDLRNTAGAEANQLQRGRAARLGFTEAGILAEDRIADALDNPIYADRIGRTEAEEAEFTAAMRMALPAGAVYGEVHARASDTAAGRTAANDAIISGVRGVPTRVPAGLGAAAGPSQYTITPPTLQLPNFQPPPPPREPFKPPAGGIEPRFSASRISAGQQLPNTTPTPRTPKPKPPEPRLEPEDFAITTPTPGGGRRRTTLGRGPGGIRPE